MSCTIGIDFGKTNMRFAIAEDDPTLTYFDKRPYTRGAQDQMHAQIFAGIDRALGEAGYAKREISAIGIDVPAVVNRDTGAILQGHGLGLSGRRVSHATDCRPLRDTRSKTSTPLGTWNAELITGRNRKHLQRFGSRPALDRCRSLARSTDRCRFENSRTI